MLVEFLLENAFLASVVAALGGVTAYMWSQNADPFVIDAHDAVMNINQQNAAVIDLRPQSAYAKGHIPGAKRIGKDELAGKLAKVAKNRPVILACELGSDARAEARKLRDSGHDTVFALRGGLRAWKEASQPTHSVKG